MSTAAFIAPLIISYLRDDLSAEESMILNNWLAASADNRLLFEKYTDMELLAGLYKQDAASKDKVWKDLEIFIAEKQDGNTSKSISNLKSDANIAPVHRVHFLRRGWFRYPPTLKLQWAKYAAAIIIVFGIGAYLWTTNKNTDRKVVNNNAPIQTDIPPGGDKAVLTLADGTEIILDSAANGNLAQQGNAEVVKLASGQIAYNLKGSSSGEAVMNTMTTPKGGQYQLTLPDGSKVWLNAASSIQFPAAFVGNERKVKITGEVYFEVAKNRQKPFIVDVDDKMDVQVLGTSFNINSYTNEEDIKATLVEGKVRITGDAKSVVLVPGQQARVTNQQLQVVNANIDQTLAWKNGIFNFHNADLKTVMKQLERWYDIKVEYSNPNSTYTFKGKMYRNVNLSDVLEMFSRMGIKFRIEGKTLIVL